MAIKISVSVMPDRLPRPRFCERTMIIAPPEIPCWASKNGSSVYIGTLNGRCRMDVVVGRDLAGPGEERHDPVSLP